jgi:hypothetical protein
LFECILGSAKIALRALEDFAGRGLGVPGARDRGFGGRDLRLPHSICFLPLLLVRRASTRLGGLLARAFAGAPVRLQPDTAGVP